MFNVWEEALYTWTVHVSMSEQNGFSVFEHKTFSRKGAMGSGFVLIFRQALLFQQAR